MIKVYTGVKGFAISLFFIAGLVVFISIFYWGIAKAAELFLPLLTVAAYAMIIIFVLVMLPAAFVKNLRPSLGIYALLMSHVLGVAAWMTSFFFIVKAFGFWGIFFAFLFQFLAPLAIVGALLQGAWTVAGNLLLWTIFTYGMRYYSQWLISLNPAPRQEGRKDIIDVDAIEVEDQD